MTRAVLDAVCKVSRITAVWVEVGASRIITVRKARGRHSLLLHVLQAAFSLDGPGPGAGAAVRDTQTQAAAGQHPPMAVARDEGKVLRCSELDVAETKKDGNSM
jgi:hypothetical protein